MSHGEKAMCHHSFAHLPLSHPTTTLVILLLIGAVNAGNGVCEGCHSFPTRTLPLRSQEDHYAHYPHFSHTTALSRGCLSSHTKTLDFLTRRLVFLIVHPHVGGDTLFLIDAEDSLCFVSQSTGRKTIFGVSLRYSEKFFRNSGRISLMTTRWRTAGRKNSQFH